MLRNNSKEEKLFTLMECLGDPNFSNNAESVDVCLDTLRKVYSDGYRHSYSDIFFNLQKIIKSADANKRTEKLDRIGANLDFIEEELNKRLLTVTDDSMREVENGFRKLSDHIALEIGRYKFVEDFCTSSSSNEPGAATHTEIDSLKKTISELEDRVKTTAATTMKAQKITDSIDEKLENNKVSSITALSIFSAVVLTFSGGFAFESGVLQGMADVGIYRLVFITSLSGFILFNTVFLLLFLVAKLAGKTISIKCRYLAKSRPGGMSRHTCGDGICTKECATPSFLCRAIRKYVYVAAVDAILLTVMLVDFFLWYFQGGEVRTTLFILIGSVLLLLVVAVCFDRVHRHKNLRRIRLHYKILLVNEIVNCGVFEQRETTSNAKIGTLKDTFCKATTNLSSSKAFAQLDLFVDEYLITQSLLSIDITDREHKIDQAKWRRLKTQFLAAYNVT